MYTPTRNKYFGIYLPQEIKLYPEMVVHLQQLAGLLYELAISLGGLSQYCDHYITDHPSLLSHATLETPPSQQEEMMDVGREGRAVNFDVPQSPPNIMCWLHKTLIEKEVCMYVCVCVCKHYHFWVVGHVITV